MTHYRRSPRSMESALSVLADELAPQTLLAEVQRVWPEVVGPSISAQAQPTAERGGVLTVSCSASVWAQELDLMSVAISNGSTARWPPGGYRGCGASPGVAEPLVQAGRFWAFCRQKEPAAEAVSTDLCAILLYTHS